jgi:hypothetical protein
VSVSNVYGFDRRFCSDGEVDFLLRNELSHEKAQTAQIGSNAFELFVLFRG